MKLTEEMLRAIADKCERVSYGKVTICLNDTSPTIDIVVEERAQYKKKITPAPGVPLLRNCQRED
jgi:hypothetical protein